VLDPKSDKFATSMPNPNTNAQARVFIVSPSFTYVLDLSSECQLQYTALPVDSTSVFMCARRGFAALLIVFYGKSR